MTFFFWIVITKYGEEDYPLFLHSRKINNITSDESEIDFSAFIFDHNLDDIKSCISLHVSALSCVVVTSNGRVVKKKRRVFYETPCEYDAS